MKSSVKWGIDVDTAVNLALKELKLDRDEVEIEVLEESQSGFLGIGSKLAKVRVSEKGKEAAATTRTSEKSIKSKSTFDDIDAILASLHENATHELPDDVREEYSKFEEEERQDDQAREKARKHDNKKNRNSNPKNSHSNSRKTPHKHQHREPDMEDILLSEIKMLESVESHPIKDFLTEIAENMGIDLSFDVKTGDEMVYVEITGKDTGTIIGKRGQTLDAVQCLSSYVVNKNGGKYQRVILDAENYRLKREKTLVNLANRLASKVERTSKSVTLEPMNPYERKVIHSTLQNHPKVQTRSEGKDPYRKVVIELR